VTSLSLCRQNSWKRSVSPRIIDIETFLLIQPETFFTWSKKLATCITYTLHYCMHIYNKSSATAKIARVVLVAHDHVTMDQQTGLWWQSVSLIIGVVVVVSTVMPENKRLHFIKNVIKESYKGTEWKLNDWAAMEGEKFERVLASALQSTSHCFWDIVLCLSYWLPVSSTHGHFDTVTSTSPGKAAVVDPRLLTTKCAPPVTVFPSMCGGWLRGSSLDGSHIRPAPDAPVCGPFDG